jgi:hypothetical protein
VNTLYNVLAGGATVLTITGCEACLLFIRWELAALMPKLGFCG